LRGKGFEKKRGRDSIERKGEKEVYGESRAP